MRYRARDTSEIQGTIQVGSRHNAGEIQVRYKWDQGTIQVVVVIAMHGRKQAGCAR